MNASQNKDLVYLCIKMNSGLASFPELVGTCRQQGVSPKETLQAVKIQEYRGKLSFIDGVVREVRHD